MALKKVVIKELSRKEKQRVALQEKEKNLIIRTKLKEAAALEKELKKKVKKEVAALETELKKH